jgi:hypothetical protein
MCRRRYTVNRVKEAEFKANETLPSSENVRARVEITGPQTCRVVGKSLSVLMMIDPTIFPRTTHTPARGWVAAAILRMCARCVF